MKILLAFTIWNKVNMLDWIADGIIDSFDPNEVDLLFLFDDPKDGSERKIYDIYYKKLKRFRMGTEVFPEGGRKFLCHNFAIDEAVKLNYDFLIASQDDQKYQDKELINNIKKIDAQYGDKLGYIGLRDGYDWGYGNMVSSQWSESVHATCRLKPGEWAEVQLVNDGGMVYTNRLMKLLGHHDTENFFHYYCETDYAMQAHKRGLQNIVMGNNLIHKKPENGASFATTYEDTGSQISAKDLQAFKNKWGV